MSADMCRLRGPLIFAEIQPLIEDAPLGIRPPLVFKGVFTPHVMTIIILIIPNLDHDPTAFDYEIYHATWVFFR